MPDIFLSYSRVDQNRARQFVKAFEAAGLSVWWDPHLKSGEAYDEVTEAALRDARAVVVLWSETSVSSRWVRAEATVADRKKTLMPVMIDPADRPIMFELVQTADLIDWRGNSDDPDFLAFLQDVRRRVDKTAAAQEERPGIAVLMFRHPPGNQEEAYFAEGMCDDIITGLGRSRLMKVTGRQSSLTLDWLGRTMADVSEQLGARYLLRGQIRRGGSGMRVVAELVDGKNDEVIWHGRYDRELMDVFKVQDEITGAIVATIEPELLGREQKQAVRGGDGSGRNLNHWNLFVRGRYHFWRSQREDISKADALLKEALALAPDDAPTLALLAQTELAPMWAGDAKDPLASLQNALAYARKAADANPRDSAAHYALGMVMSFMGQAEKAIAEQRLALMLNPWNAAAQGELGRVLAFHGDVEGALTACDAAIALSPHDPHDWLWLRSKAVAELIAGRHDAALAHATPAAARRPDYFFLHFCEAACAAAAGKTEIARAACAEGMALNPRYRMKWLALGHPFSNPAHLEMFAGHLKAAGWPG
ncbi:TIR domain-containing protein [Sandarakinorhabdus sp. AAP62]|uniref:TIR domain-containing protein n=1 Tax=Sandarakinorhabdus sp. AAP62 TaxID=1248916 RepID=UPI0012674BA9|nr:TIR domain-containing protein [Sandarakinorhabdus sp. AAP62]